MLSAGMGLQADVLRARLETEQWNRRLVTNQADIDRKRAALAYAIGRADTSTLVDPVLPDSLPTLPDLAAGLSSESLEGTPEVHRARLQAQAAGADVRQAKLGVLPYIGVGAAYGFRQDLRTNGTDPHTGVPTQEVMKQDNMVTLEVTVPLPLFYRRNQHAQISEFQAMQRSADFGAERLKLAKAQELRELHALLQEKIGNYEITARSVLPQAENAWQASLLDYRGAKLPFMTLTEARMNVVMAEMDAIMLRADAWATIYRWRAALGQPLFETGKR
jgi:outer membrane protein TolC